jgi:hypothetical protein
MLCTVIQWGDPAYTFRQPTTLASFFDYILWVTRERAPDPKVQRRTISVDVSHLTTGGLLPERRSAVEPTGSATLLDRGKGAAAAAQSMATAILARLAFPGASRDHFSRALDSGAELTDAAIAARFGLADFATKYYTVGSSLLVTVLETPNPENPLVLIARGPSGRTVWTVRENAQGALPDPQLSDEVRPETLPPAAPVAFAGEKLPDPVPDPIKLSAADLDARDDALRAIYGPAYQTWLPAEDFGFAHPFNYKAPFQRPRVVDFLAGMGLFQKNNEMHLRAHKMSDKLATVLSKFDAIGNLTVVPIPLCHLLPSDTTLDYTPEHATRMTPLMEQFLKKIAEPIQISDEAAADRRLPAFKSSVPVIPCGDGFAAIISPAMCKDGAGEWLRSQRGTIRIFFDEADFEVKHAITPGPGWVLIIKPAVNGLYYVWQVHDGSSVISPFASKQLLSAKTIAFYIALVLDLAQSDGKSADAVQKERKGLIADLCSETHSQYLGPLSIDAFSS